MYSDHDLEAAVAAGVIDRPTVERLRDYLARSRNAPPVDEEHFRLLTGFNDIFVSIATVLVLGALAWLGEALPLGPGDLAEALAGALVAAASWALAEFFTRRRRMALPSILLLLGFVAGCCVATFGAWQGEATSHRSLASDLRHGTFVLTAATGAIAAFAHWRRFHVPITPAVASAGVVALVLSLLTAAMPSLSHHLAGLSFTGGLGVFTLALRWDLSDPRRETRRADVAFWLHLLAAPLIVHSAVAMSGVLNGSIGGLDAAFIVVVYVMLGIVALVIDRRALMVSGLAYVIYALSSLFRQMSAFNLNLAITALVLGSALLVLSVFWARLRRMMLSLLPQAVRHRLPPAGMPLEA